jgi:alpha-tubulin suppressor-like RCC1 family protein
MKTILPASIGLLLAVLGCTGEPTAPVASTPPAVSAAATATAALAFWQISGGRNFTCAVTTAFVPYCWGENTFNQLGVGTTGPDACLTEGGQTFSCAKRPTRVLGGLHFQRVTAGFFHGCGVTADFHAWCWGSGNGVIGSGNSGPASAPEEVAGGLRFRQVEAGGDHTCGITYPDDRLYCWGQNVFGQLGDGSTSTRQTPVAVLSTLRFAQVSAGNHFTCAVTKTGRAFCWGINNNGQVGDSTNARFRSRPVAVVGAHTFRQLDAGVAHTCGVTTTDRAFCWGNGREGQLGNGKTYLSYWPRAVSGGLQFRRVAAGQGHTCAETTGSKAYCWGSNVNGQLGSGGPKVSPVAKPVAVAGGRFFAQVTAGTDHSCGKTSAGVGYCWGDNFYGELGNGASGDAADSGVPVAVAGAE